MRSLIERLFTRLDIASLVFFRILFGLIMVWEVWRYFENGWIRSQYIAPEFHFKYFGFTWVEPWDGNGMYWHFLVLGIAGLFVAAGFLYRLSAVVMFLAFTYVFLLDQARYLNHFYLVSLMSFLMVFIPAHRAFSIDALIWRTRRSDTAPAWALWLLRAQIGIVYFYAAVAKMNYDWLHGEPIRMWLAERKNYTLAGEFLPVGKLFTLEPTVWIFASGGLLLDLFITPALLWRRTRALAYGAACSFHLTNAFLFDIGIFPWFMLAATLLFFDPDWPRRIFNWPRGRDTVTPSTGGVTWGRRAVAAAIAFYLLMQVLVPLRHFLYPGTVHWTEEGHRFAWHMKLRNKRSRVTVTVHDQIRGREKEIRLRDRLTTRQIRKMGARPDMLLQFCHLIAQEYEADGFEVEVRADCKASLNGREYQVLVDPEVDLGHTPRNLRTSSWIVPLTTPLVVKESSPERDED